MALLSHIPLRLSPLVSSWIEGLAMFRWLLRLLIGLVMIALTAVATGPWLLYAIGLAKIDGRPSHASHVTVTPQDVEALFRTLRISLASTPSSHTTSLARSAFPSAT